MKEIKSKNSKRIPKEFKKRKLSDLETITGRYDINRYFMSDYDLEMLDYVTDNIDFCKYVVMHFNEFEIDKETIENLQKFLETFIKYFSTNYDIFDYNADVLKLYEHFFDLFLIGDELRLQALDDITLKSSLAIMSKILKDYLETLYFSLENIKNNLNGN